ncbi:GPP34 family phosphoprotein [Dactylosporangium sp. CS-033363]|uniref:GPP34 family phosphoprotein n=1 Tax=Dactylosporangium sp. CS-033363 TaxID=3239935 RepID=UPI003D8E2814
MDGGVLVQLRAALAVAMLAGFYVLGAALAAAVGWVAVWLLLIDPGSPDAQAGALALGALAVALLVPGAAALLSSGEPPPRDGVAVDETQAPGLWAQTRELAKLAGTRPPDEIRLVAAVNAAVWQDTGALGLRAGRRVLLVGAPLLLVWPVARVRAVLAHELAHYSRRHTGLAAITYRGMQAMTRTIADAGPAGFVLALYAAPYAAVSLAVRRRTELEADDLAARVAGPDALAAALQDLGPLSATWELLIASYAGWARTEGYEPQDVLLRFERDPRLAPARPSSPGPFDTHPSLEVRVARLAGGTSGTPGEERPAVELLADPGLLMATLRTPDFDDVVAAAARAEARLDVARLKRVGGLDRAVSLLEEDPDGPESTTAIDFVVAALVAAGRAEYTHAWSRPLRLEPAGVARTVRAAAEDPDEVPALVELLVGFGLLQRRGTPLPMGPLSGPGRLADDLFDVSFSPRDQRRRTDLRVFPAALAAATLMDLRRAGCIDTSGHVLRVVGEATGDRYLDAVLARLAAAPPRRVDTWLTELGSDVVETVATRRRLMGRYGQQSTYHSSNESVRPGFDAEVRERVLAALDRGPALDPDLDLGVLLWATETAGAVLGRQAVQARFLLGRIAAEDPIARAVRTVAGHGVSVQVTTDPQVS